MGRLGIQEKNTEGEIGVDFDYILCRWCNLKEISECSHRWECSQTAKHGGVLDDYGGEEDEKGKGTAEDKVMEKGRVLYDF